MFLLYKLNHFTISPSLLFGYCIKILSPSSIKISCVSLIDVSIINNSPRMHRYVSFSTKIQYVSKKKSYCIDFSIALHVITPYYNNSSHVIIASKSLRLNVFKYSSLFTKRLILDPLISISSAFQITCGKYLNLK